MRGISLFLQPPLLLGKTDRLKKIKPNSWKAGVEMPTKEPATGVRRTKWGEGKWVAMGSGRVGLLECGAAFRKTEPSSTYEPYFCL